MGFLDKISNEKRISIIAKELKERKILRFLEAHNGLSGIIVDQIKAEKTVAGRKKMLEFDGFWESSFTDSASKGLPDVEIVSFDSRLETINQIMEVTHKPMIVDGDTGGDLNQFEYLVRRLEKVGVSMVVIEDKIFPKRNSLESGTKQELENPDFFAEKIRRGQLVKSNPDFLIVARLESLIAGLGMKDAIDRAVVYLKAGADGILIHSKKESPGEILEFAKKFKKLSPELTKGKIFICIPTTYNTITEEELREAGFNIVIYANHLLRSSFATMEKVAREILVHGRSFEASSQCAPVKKIFEKVGFLDIKEKDKELANKFGSKVRVLIPAAGRDSLSEKYQIPRSLIDINGKNILQRQIETFRKAGLNKFFVVTGYKSDLFDMENIVYRNNPNYENEYILSSIFSAADCLNSPFIFTYSDILFNESIVKGLLKVGESEGASDIILVVDDAFQYNKYLIDKKLDFVVTKNKIEEDIRKITDEAKEEIISIGKQIAKDSADYEFNGIAYFSKKGADILKQVYWDCLEKYSDRPFHEAANIHQANFTDIIQEIIDRGYVVKAMKVYKGWIEIHDECDLELARKLYKNS